LSGPTTLGLSLFCYIYHTTLVLSAHGGAVG
jgi:hypothetical protein